MRLFFSSSSSSSSSSTSQSPGGKFAKDKKKKKKSKKVTKGQSRRTPLPPPIIIPNSDCSSSLAFSTLSSLQTPTPDKISREEIELVLRRLGGDGCDAEAEISAMIAEADPVDGDGLISVDWFTGFPGDHDDLRVAFGVFDANGDGKISAEELHDAFAMLGDGNCKVEDCRRMIGGVDSDGDGFVSFGDFVRMMALDG